MYFVIGIVILVIVVVALGYSSKSTQVVNSGNKTEYVGNSVVFTNGCKVDKTDLKVKNNTIVRLDNQSPEDILVRMLGVSYPVKAHSFVDQQVSAPHIPAVFTIGCLGSTDNTKVLLY